MDPAGAATIGILGGLGWMGDMLAHSLLTARLIDPRSLTLCSRRNSASRTVSLWPGVVYTPDAVELVNRSDVIVLSVRPQQFGSILMAAHDKLVISVMAGVSVEAIRLQTGAQRIVRAMPNAAAQIARSFTPWFSTPAVTAAERIFVQKLFETCGTADAVSTERDIDYLSGLTGSGPAFPALLADALMSHARARGLPADIARKAVDSLICGGGRLMEDVSVSPGEILQKFMGYEGTTAAALRKMIAHGFIAAVHAGLDAAEARSLEMSVNGKEV
jgi:pyrroline-5-carboxylate reductase